MPRRKRKPWKRPSQSKPCEKCGGVKRPGQGQRYCQECYELAVWRAETKEKGRRLMSRQPCIDCGGRKEPGHGKRLCAKCKAKRRIPRYCRCGVQIEPPKRLCPACKLEAIAKRRDYDRARHRLYRQTHRIKRKPLTLAERQNVRINYRLRRERNGQGPARKPPGPWRPGARDHVPVDPLLPFLRERAVNEPIGAFAEDAGVRPNTVEAVLRGETPTILLASADRLCVALGLTLSLLYPDVAA